MLYVIWIDVLTKTAYPEALNRATPVRHERIQPLRSHWVGNRESPYADDAP